MPQLMTAEELLYANVPNKRTELVRGRLIVYEPPVGGHGYVAANLAFRLSQHIDVTGAGAVFVGDVGFTLRRDPDTVRGPDVAFVRKDRLPQHMPNTYLEFAPDLVVEVLSPNDRPGEVLAKLETGSMPVRAWCGWSIRNAASRESTEKTEPRTCWTRSTSCSARTSCRASAARWRRFSVGRNAVCFPRAFLLVALAGCATASPKYHPRVVVTTDPELDDANSLIRYVLYSPVVRANSSAKATRSRS